MLEMVPLFCGNRTKTLFLYGESILVEINKRIMLNLFICDYEHLLSMLTAVLGIGHLVLRHEALKSSNILEITAIVFQLLTMSSSLIYCILLHTTTTWYLSN